MSAQTKAWIEAAVRVAATGALAAYATAFQTCLSQHAGAVQVCLSGSWNSNAALMALGAGLVQLEAFIRGHKDIG